MASLKTQRLWLRPFTLADLPALAKIYGDPQVMRYIRAGQPASAAETQASLQLIQQHWAAHGFGLWAAVHKADQLLIGFCGLKYLDQTSEVELGYRLTPAYWGRGLATEGGRASLQYGFQTLKLDRIVAVVHPANLASQRVVAKLGFRYEREAHYYNMPLQYYSLNRSAFQQPPGRPPAD